MPVGQSVLTMNYKLSNMKIDQMITVIIVITMVVIIKWR